MATRALQQVVTYLAWDTSANAYKTGDSANHTTSWVKDGTRSATTNAAAEVDSSNCPGMYKVTLTATETDCIEGVLGGKSSTANIVLIPTMVAFDYLNTSAPATAGVPDVALTSASATSVAGVIATTAITESYRTNGTAPTPAQFMSEVLAHLGESAISGTTKTIKKMDHSTTAETFTLDSATSPSSITRAS